MQLFEFFFQRTALGAAARLAPYVLRQTNPVTGAPVPQAVLPVAPQPPPVVLS